MLGDPAFGEPEGMNVCDVETATIGMDAIEAEKCERRGGRFPSTMPFGEHPVVIGEHLERSEVHVRKRG